MKAFTRFFVSFVFLCLMFQSCFVNFNAITGNGNLLREEFTISDYNEIKNTIKIEGTIEK